MRLSFKNPCFNSYVLGR